jgi:RNA polymerase sigma factor (sigma-70 family)
VDAKPEPLELLLGESAELVVSDRNEEVDLARELQQLHGSDRTAAGRLQPRRLGMDDRPGLGHAIDGGEANPFDVADDSRPHEPSLTFPGSRALEKMMAFMHVPPFEQFYDDNRAAVLGELRRLLGAQAAEDAYQETFLRALRAYNQLRHADNLRAWALTIARRVAADQHRRRDAEPEAPEPSLDPRPAYAELGELAGALPRKERAAVVLRYGYDLSYAAIGAALGSSEQAARQAASSGIRRLRRSAQ